MVNIDRLREVMPSACSFTRDHASEDPPLVIQGLVAIAMGQGLPLEAADVCARCPYKGCRVRRYRRDTMER